MQKYDRTEDEAFPPIDPGVRPLGNRVLVQIRSPKKTAGSIILTSESMEQEMWNEMTAKVIALGPVAYKNRDTLKDWPEGNWITPGKFVRVPKYGGDRIQQGEVGDENCALFVIFNDYEIISEITCDPLSLKTCY